MPGSKRFLLVFLILAVAGGADALSAQRGLGYGGLGLNGLGPRLGENVALALDLQSELGLSSEQIQALQDLGAGIQLDVAPLEEEIDGLRNQILAGEVAERDGLVELQNLLADYEAAAEPYRSGITTILSAVQHRSLQAAMFETRPYLDQGVLGARAGYGRGVAYGRGLSPGFGYGVRPAYGRGGAMGFRGNMALGARGGVGLGAGRAGRNFLRFSPRGIRYRR